VGVCRDGGVAVEGGERCGGVEGFDCGVAFVGEVVAAASDPDGTGLDGLRNGAGHGDSGVEVGGIASVHALAGLDVEEVADVGGHADVAGGIEQHGGDVCGAEGLDNAGNGGVGDGVEIDAP